METTKLYENYGRTSDDTIKRHLKRIKLLKRDGDKFYEYTTESIQKVLDKPRNISLGFESDNTIEYEMKHMIEVKEISYLCKSSSRFFLKPDIGEIFDQIEESELNRINGIAFNQDTQGGPINEDYDHFIMTAWLLLN
jgi:hypothetical protein